MKLSNEAWKTIRWVLVTLLIGITIIFVAYAIFIPDQFTIIIDYGENFVKATETLERIA